MWEDFKSWLAVSPVASGLRSAIAIGLFEALNFISDHYLEWSLPVPVQVAVAALIPVSSRWLNAKDGIFGRGKESDAEDEATA